MGRANVNSSGLAPRGAGQGTRGNKKNRIQKAKRESVDLREGDEWNSMWLDCAWCVDWFHFYDKCIYNPRVRSILGGRGSCRVRECQGVHWRKQGDYCVRDPEGGKSGVCKFQPGGGGVPLWCHVLWRSWRFGCSSFSKELKLWTWPIWWYGLSRCWGPGMRISWWGMERLPFHEAKSPCQWETAAEDLVPAYGILFVDCSI